MGNSTTRPDTAPGDELQDLLDRRETLLAELEVTNELIRTLCDVPDPLDPLDPDFTQALVEHCHRAKQNALRNFPE